MGVSYRCERYRTAKSILGGPIRKPRVRIAAYTNPITNQMPPAHFAERGTVHQIPRQKMNAALGTNKSVRGFHDFRNNLKTIQTRYGQSCLSPKLHGLEAH
jgi:hypothetical protein